MSVKDDSVSIVVADVAVVSTPDDVVDAIFLLLPRLVVFRTKLSCLRLLDELLSVELPMECSNTNGEWCRRMLPDGNRNVDEEAVVTKAHAEDVPGVVFVVVVAHNRGVALAEEVREEMVRRRRRLKAGCHRGLFDAVVVFIL